MILQINFITVCYIKKLLHDIPTPNRIPKYLAKLVFRTLLNGTIHPNDHAF